MKKHLLLAGLGLCIASSAYAMPGMGGPMMDDPPKEYDAPPRAKHGKGMRQMTPEQQQEMKIKFKSFLIESRPLRDKMHQNRMAMEAEYVKDSPDKTVMNTLRNQSREFHQEMIELHKKHGLPMPKMGRHNGARNQTDQPMPPMEPMY